MANAPPPNGLRMITACTTSGIRAVQLWGLDQRNALASFYVDIDRKVSGWLGPESSGANRPKQFIHVAAAQQSNLRVQLWGIDHRQQLWSCTESYRRGEWDKWEGPNWNKQPRPFNSVCGCQQGGNQSCVLWALDQDYNLLTCHQEKFNHPWSDWVQVGSPPGSQLFHLTAAQQNDGRIALWALDTRLQLWCTYQTSPGGPWTGWNGPNWEKAPKLMRIVAAKQGGDRGAVIWGITREYTLVSNYQEIPGANWNGWNLKDWHEPVGATHVAAAAEWKGAVHLWVIDQIGMMVTKSQVSAGGSWGNWEFVMPSWYVPPDAPE